MAFLGGGGLGECRAGGGEWVGLSVGREREGGGKAGCGRVREQTTVYFYQPRRCKVYKSMIKDEYNEPPQMYPLFIRPQTELPCTPHLTVARSFNSIQLPCPALPSFPSEYQNSITKQTRQYLKNFCMLPTGLSNTISTDLHSCSSRYSVLFLFLLRHSPS